MATELDDAWDSGMETGTWSALDAAVDAVDEVLREARMDASLGGPSAVDYLLDVRSAIAKLRDGT